MKASKKDSELKLSDHGEEHRLTKIGAALTIISTIVGGGIVGLPYAFYYTGLAMGIGFILVMAIQTVLSVELYLAAKDFLPGKPESMFEMGYIIFKRNSIFFICSIIILNSFGLMLVYFIVFGDTLSSLVSDLNSNVNEDDFFGKRMAYVIILSLCLVPLILKKELQELKIISVFLFVSIFTFIILTITQLIRGGVK
tara:strand:- start:530 stop:1120 length:591 start_codon:yes stop_codon:yes gene_type:complete